MWTIFASESKMPIRTMPHDPISTLVDCFIVILVKSFMKIARLTFATTPAFADAFGFEEVLAAVSKATTFSSSLSSFLSKLSRDCELSNFNLAIAVIFSYICHPKY